MLTRLVTIAMMASSIAATVITRSETLLNPPLSSLSSRSILEPGFNEVRTAMTNAERLARGLPLKMPVMKHRSYVSRNQPSNSPSVTETGYIKVSIEGSQDLWVYRIPNAFGEYGITSDISQALLASYTTSASDSGSPVDITILNAVSSSYPLFGGVVGFSNNNDNIAPGSFNYVYAAGIGQSTGAGASPANVPNAFSGATSIDKSAESTIWSIDAITKEITAQWINDDGSAPATYILYVASDDVIVLTGDVDAFRATFGPTPRADLVFVKSIPAEASATP